RLLGDDPSEGYALEMNWRRLQACGDRAWQPEASGSGSLSGQLRQEANTLDAALAGQCSVHCVFHRSGDAIVRWTAFSGHVERDPLSAPVDSIAAWVAAVRRGLDASSIHEPKFLMTSARLAHVLLPQLVFEAAGKMRLLISGDDFLAQFPIGAL